MSIRCNWNFMYILIVLIWIESYKGVDCCSTGSGNDETRWGDTNGVKKMSDLTRRKNLKLQCKGSKTSFSLVELCDKIKYCENNKDHDQAGKVVNMYNFGSEIKFIISI